MKELIMLFILGALALWGAKEKMGKAPQGGKPAMPVLCRPVPGGNNWRSGQPDSLQLDTALRTDRLRLVVRLNGDGKDAGALKVRQEQALCERYGVMFTRLDVEQTGALEWLHGQMLLGAVYVHCLHGMDRTGAGVGFHLRAQGFDEARIIEHNRWERYLEYKGRKYQRYWDMALGK